MGVKGVRERADKRKRGQTQTLKIKITASFFYILLFITVLDNISYATSVLVTFVPLLACLSSCWQDYFVHLSTHLFARSFSLSLYPPLSRPISCSICNLNITAALLFFCGLRGSDKKNERIITGKYLFTIDDSYNPSKFQPLGI